MFFPFLDYKTVDASNSNASAILAYTVEYRSMVVVELVQSNANDSNKGVRVYAEDLGYTDDPTEPTLFSSGGGVFGHDDYGPVPYIFPRSGAKIYFRRADQYGSAQIKLHIFRLPEA